MSSSDRASPQPAHLEFAPKLTTVSAVLDRLNAQHTADQPSALTFDADGTLWSGDVGEDVFEFALEHDLLHSDALAALRAAAAQHNLPTRGNAAAVGRTIFEAYRAGRFPEREVCAVMTWCYAGFSEADFARLAREALARAKLDARLHQELAPILAWARAEAVKICVISASPQHIVEEAAGFWSFAAECVIASRPKVRAGRILPELASDVPYAEAKCTAARSALGNRRWLASFGDNIFDFEMLREAELGVAVKPKPRLLERLGELSNTLILP